MNDLIIPKNTVFECDFYDYGNMIYVSMNYRCGVLRHAIGKDHYITHKSQLVNKRIANECKEILLKWFWRRLGAL